MRGDRHPFSFLVRIWRAFPLLRKRGKGAASKLLSIIIGAAAAHASRERDDLAKRPSCAGIGDRPSVHVRGRGFVRRALCFCSVTKAKKRTLLAAARAERVFASGYARSRVCVRLRDARAVRAWRGHRICDLAIAAVRTVAASRAVQRVELATGQGRRGAVIRRSVACTVAAHTSDVVAGGGEGRGQRGV